MELSREYLESLSFEVVKQKYYNANKVNAVFSELKSAILQLIEENEELRSSETELLKAQTELEAFMLRSEQLADENLRSANEAADKIIADAKVEADEMLAGAELIMATAKLEAAQAKDEAARIQAKAAAVDAHVEKMIANAKDQGAWFGQSQLDAIDEVISQLDEMSIQHETRMLQIKQTLMDMVTGA